MQCRLFVHSLLKNDLVKHKVVWLVLVPRVLEKFAIGVQNKFFLGSPAVKTLAKLFMETGQLRAKHTKVAKGLIVADKPPSRWVGPCRVA
jgi:long-subunit acyl-CoA synthetase (AMP-forming)